MLGRRVAALLALSITSLVALHPAGSAAGPAARSTAPPRVVNGPDSPGSSQWGATYDGPGTGSDSAYAVGVSPDGSKVFVTGASSGSTSHFDYATVAYDARTRTDLWVARYNGPANDFDYALALGVSPDGSKVFVTGRSVGTTSGDDYTTIAYDAFTGAQLWVTRYNGPGNGLDIAYALGVSPDGSKVFVTGLSDGGPATHFDYATVAYKAATGAKLWVSRYNPPRSLDDVANALGVSPDGSKVFVTGRIVGPTTDDYATIAYDATTGTQLWVTPYNGPANGTDVANALRVSPDGSNVFVTGYSLGSTSDYDYATVAYNASTGTELWVVRYNGPGSAADVARALSVSPDGSKVFVAGDSYGSSSFDDYATVVYSASTGAQLWVERYNGQANGTDSATALGLSPDGSKVFVTGYSRGFTTLYDYVTIGYDASTGARLWVMRATAPETGDFATALAIDPDGSKVIVTGYSHVLANRHYRTVAISIT